MPKFILEIELGNEAMLTPKDIGDALCEISRDLKTRHTTCSHPEATGRINIRDYNGNVFGHYEVVDTPTPRPIAPIVDADTIQREQAQDSGYAHRFSLRDEK